MADPAPVAQTFVDESVQECFRLDGIVTLVDAKQVSWVKSLFGINDQVSSRLRPSIMSSITIVEGPRTGGPGRRHARPPRVRGRPGKWPKSDEFSRCEQ